MPTASGFLTAGQGRRLISVSAPVIFSASNKFRQTDQKMVQGIRLIH